MTLKKMTVDVLLGFSMMHSNVRTQLVSLTVFKVTMKSKFTILISNQNNLPSLLH